MPDLNQLLQTALTARATYFDEQHNAAFRLFNGFYEGCPQLVIDLYGRTAVIHNYAKPAHEGNSFVAQAQTHLQTQLPWLEAILLKTRHGNTPEDKNGRLLMGDKADTSVTEHGVRYALELTVNRDAGLYLDTRNLRQWLLDNCADQTVLNTFAYTGSLGVAAYAAGAKRVVQTDINKKFLNVAKTSHTLNGFPIEKTDFRTGNFWGVTKRFNREKVQFDTIILDPPFFSTTGKGNVDLAQNVGRLINKLRPLVRNNGRIIAINNALFVSGADYHAALETLCQDGYVSIEGYIPVSDDFTGSSETIVNTAVTDPAPFNHSTKIAILRIQHK